MSPRSRILIFPALLMLVGCDSSLDSLLWECQLAAQKENAGRSTEAIADRAVAIDACMADKGYGRDTRDVDCRQGKLLSGCYRQK
jgi:hypothetical protein